MELKKKQPLGVELVKKGIVSTLDIERALAHQKENPGLKMGDCIYELGLCDPKVLITAIGEVIGEKGIILKAEDVKQNISEYLPLDIAKKSKAVPFETGNGKAKVCFSSTTNQKNIDNIKLAFLNKGMTVDVYVTFEREIDEILHGQEGSAKKTFSQDDLSGSIISLVDSILKTGMDKRASDIHIEPQENVVRVRYRIDGEIVEGPEIPKEKQEQLIGRLKAISNMHQEKKESQDGRILDYDQFNIRVSSQNNIHGEKFVLRLLKKNSKIRTIFDLGYLGTEEEFKKYINKKNSVTLVSAPTGEGKTTTLYSIITALNTPKVNITTIEDPVEIRIAGLNQIETDVKATFASSLRTVLRQDPDIILVGEIRDKETSEIAIQAGQTGHYVLSTIHTIDSIEVINRLRKIGISNYDIASTLATAVSQRLIRRLCPHCKKPKTPTAEEKTIIEAEFKKYGDKVEKYEMCEPVGCEHCEGTGYFERIAAFEFLEITDEIKEMIVEGASSYEIRKAAVQGAFRPLLIDGMKKVALGHTTLEELNKKLLFM